MNQTQYEKNMKIQNELMDFYGFLSKKRQKYICKIKFIKRICSHCHDLRGSSICLHIEVEMYIRKADILILKKFKKIG